MKKLKLITSFLLVLFAFAPIVKAGDSSIPVGDNQWRTLGGRLFFDTLFNPPIPEDFFYLGSPLFNGEITLVGEPSNPFGGNYDTTVARMEPLVLFNLGDTATIGIELVELNLVSAAPIDVGGELYDVVVLGGPAAVPGSMTVTKTHENGGVFSVNVPIDAVITFTHVGGVLPPKVLMPPTFVLERVLDPDIPFTTLTPPNPAQPVGTMFIEPCKYAQLATTDGALYLTQEQGYADPNATVGCYARVNAQGIVDLPAECPYTTCDKTMTLTDGFPAGSGLNLAIDLGNAVGISTSPGGSLGGTITTYTSDWCMDFTGFGALAGFVRSICALVIIEVHNSPLKSGGVMMTIQEDMVSISGSIFGDPDFDLLNIQGGSNFGLPSPGHTTLSVLGDGNWNVHSFLDIEYTISYIGAPGSILEGLGGTDTNRTRFKQGCPLPAPSCTVPDNGAGTVDFPAGCDYESRDEFIEIFVDESPSTTSMRCAAFLSVFEITSVTPGGNLGGEVLTFNADLFLVITGEGALDGFNRIVFLPVVGETHTAPRTPGDAVQDFDTEMFSLSGSLFGDPDFDILSISAGSNNGLPSPGHTTVTQLPTGDWNVDSFFDVTYQITFNGAPGGALDGLTGGNTGVVRFIQGWEEEPMPADYFSGLPHHPLNYACLSPNASGNLVVSNIGSSGEDGVSIDLGEAQGFQCVVDFGPVGALPTGGLFKIKSRVIGAGGSAAVVFRGQADGKAQIEVRAGSKYRKVEIRVKLDNNIVSSQSFVEPFPNPLVIANIGSSGEDGVTIRTVTPDSDGLFIVDSFFDIEYAIPGDTQISGAPGFVVADAIRLVLTPVGDIAEPPLTGVDITGGASLAQGQITEVNPSGKIGTALIQDNHVHEALGQAHIIGGGSLLGGPSGGLRVSNIGSSGLDGVRIEPIPPPRSVGQSFVLDATDSQDDSQVNNFILTHIGTLGGITDQTFQETTLPLNGTNREIRMSSEPWLEPNATVQILLNGFVISTVPNVPLGGRMAFRVNNSDIPVTLRSTMDTTGNPPVTTGMYHSYAWESVSLIGVDSQPFEVGDEIRIETFAILPLAAGESVVDDLQGVVVLCSTSGGSGGTIWLDIGDVSTTFIDLCPSDTNDSGAVNVTDLLALLAAWGPNPGHPADINNDGNVNVTDLLALLAAWGLCP